MRQFDRRLTKAVDNMDLEQLAMLMIQSRLPNDVQRARVWPNMVGCGSQFITKEVYYFLSQQPHRDQHTVDVDVLRSLNNHGISLNENQFQMYRAALHRMLTAVIALYKFIGMPEQEIETAVLKAYVKNNPALAESAGGSPAVEPYEHMSYADVQREQLHEIEHYSRLQKRQQERQGPFPMDYAGPQRQRTPPLALGINGVGLQDEHHQFPPSTFQSSFKPFSMYDTFIDELVDGGDRQQVQQVQQHIHGLQQAGTSQRQRSVETPNEASPTLLARDYLQPPPPPLPRTSSKAKSAPSSEPRPSPDSSAVGAMAMSDSFVDKVEQQMEFDRLYDKFMYGVQHSGGVLQQDTRQKRKVVSSLLFSRRSTSDCEPQSRFLQQADMVSVRKPWQVSQSRVRQYKQAMRRLVQSAEQNVIQSDLLDSSQTPPQAVQIARYTRTSNSLRDRSSSARYEDLRELQSRSRSALGVRTVSELPRVLSNVSLDTGFARQEEEPATPYAVQVDSPEGQKHVHADWNDKAAGQVVALNDTTTGVGLELLSGPEPMIGQEREIGQGSHGAGQVSGSVGEAAVERTPTTWQTPDEGDSSSSRPNPPHSQSDSWQPPAEASPCDWQTEVTEAAASRAGSGDACPTPPGGDRSREHGKDPRGARRALSMDGDAARQAAEWARQKDSRERTRQQIERQGFVSALHFRFGREHLDKSGRVLWRDRHRSLSRSGPFDVLLEGGGHMSSEEVAAWKVAHIVEQLLSMKQEYTAYQMAQQAATQVVSTIRATGGDADGSVLGDPGRLSSMVYYYQGLHDVAGVLLLTVGEVIGFKVLSGLVARHLRDYTRSNLDAVMQSQQLIPLLLQVHDPQLAQHLRDVGIPPFFGLSWQLTWFAHTLDDFGTVQRLFDFFIASHPLMPLYVAVINMHLHRDYLMGFDEMPELHGALTKLPFPIIPRKTQRVIAGALALFKRAPPLRLAVVNQLPIGSCSLFHAVCVNGLWHVPSAPQQLPHQGDQVTLAQRLVQRYVDWLGLRPMMYSWGYMRSLQVGFAVSLLAIMVTRVDPERSHVLMEQLKMVFGFR